MYSTNVFNINMLDEEYAQQFEKPWVLEKPDGTNELFDTEKEACARQRELG